MSRWGIGLIFTFLSIAYSIIIFSLDRLFYPLFQIEIVPSIVLIIPGILLIVAGIPFFIISVIKISRAYNANTLVTNGIFRCCRHPLYASWTVFIVPGIILLSKSWIGLTIPIFMYFLLLILVKKEENYLIRIFGSEYLEYKRRVPCILPYGCFRNHPR